MSNIPMLLSDAEILSSIKSTMTRKQTMSLPLHLLKGNSSLDALENALRAESKFVSPAPSLRRRSLVPGSQAQPCPLTLKACWCLSSINSVRAGAPAWGQHHPARQGHPFPCVHSPCALCLTARLCTPLSHRKLVNWHGQRACNLQLRHPW